MRAAPKPAAVEAVDRSAVPRARRSASVSARAPRSGPVAAVAQRASASVSAPPREPATAAAQRASAPRSGSPSAAAPRISAGEPPAQRRRAPPPRGILSSQAPDGTTTHQRLLPCEALAQHVAHFWVVRWELRAPFNAQTLPHPCVHVTFETGAAGPVRAEVGGVHRARFSRTLRDEGAVFGIKFRPAAFQLEGGAHQGLSQRVLPVERVFGPGACAWAKALFAAGSLEEQLAVSEAFLMPRLAPLSEEVVGLRDLIERVATDRTLVRVEQLAELAGLSVRALQRRFTREAGVSPKWVLQRYRLLEAAEQLKGPHPLSIAALADALGYFDQAHFTRAFTQVVGQAPAAFARAARAVSPSL